MTRWVSGQDSPVAAAMILSSVLFLMAGPVMSARHSGHSLISGLTNQRRVLGVLTNKKLVLYLALHCEQNM